MTEKILAQLAHVRTSVLDVACEQSGPAGSLPVVLLHGYPYDARAFDEVVAIVNSAGARLFRICAGTAPRASCRPTHHVQESRRHLGRIFSNCSMRSRYGKLSWQGLIGAVEQPA